MKNEKAKSISEDKKLDEMELQSMLEAYGNDVLRLCTLYLKDRHLAEDALQETFIKVWQKYHTYLGQANEKTWIMRIAINVCKNYLRTAWIKRNSVVQIEDIAKLSVLFLQVSLAEQEFYQLTHIRLFTSSLLNLIPTDR